MLKGTRDTIDTGVHYMTDLAIYCYPGGQGGNLLYITPDGGEADLGVARGPVGAMEFGDRESALMVWRFAGIQAAKLAQGGEAA